MEQSLTNKMSLVKIIIIAVFALVFIAIFSYIAFYFITLNKINAAGDAKAKQLYSITNQFNYESYITIGYNNDPVFMAGSFTDDEYGETATATINKIEEPNHYSRVTQDINKHLKDLGIIENNNSPQVTKDMSFTVISYFYKLNNDNLTIKYWLSANDQEFADDKVIKIVLILK